VHDGHDLDHRRGEERLVGEAQVGGGDVAFDRLDAVGAGDVDDQPAGDAGQDAALRRRKEGLVAHHEDRRGRALGEHVILAHEDPLIGAVV
jgi:hypothetical protein